ncbi:MAG: hypothetical protein ACXW5U_18420 [Thermoanaerobaculia bacterium]
MRQRLEERRSLEHRRQLPDPSEERARASAAANQALGIGPSVDVVDGRQFLDAESIRAKGLGQRSAGVRPVV